jgi:hypothetical protein
MADGQSGDLVMEVKGDGYRVAYDVATATVMFEGVLRLRGTVEYAPIDHMLDEVVRIAPQVITLDLRGLAFLNSAGIDLLVRFALQVREGAASRLVVRGSADIPWQVRSLSNLKKVMPGLQLDLA